MERGDITQSSFAAIFGDCKWVVENVNGKETCTRTVMTIGQLFDVSPVTFPAYEDTEAEAMKRSAGLTIVTANGTAADITVIYK